MGYPQWCSPSASSSGKIDIEKLCFCIDLPQYMSQERCVSLFCRWFYFPDKSQDRRQATLPELWWGQCKVKAAASVRKALYTNLSLFPTHLFTARYASLNVIADRGLGGTHQKWSTHGMLVRQWVCIVTFPYPQLHSATSWDPGVQWWGLPGQNWGHVRFQLPCDWRRGSNLQKLQVIFWGHRQWQRWRGHRKFLQVFGG